MQLGRSAARPWRAPAPSGDGPQSGRTWVPTRSVGTRRSWSFVPTKPLAAYLPISFSRMYISSPS
jgi:hypothetical protein